MKSFSKKALVLGVMLAVGATAQAAYLGQLQVTSQASQNFQATFLVHDVSPTGSSLTARLAPAETYSKYGITMPETAKGLNLALINKSPLTLRISSSRPAVERAFPLLVELNEGGHVTVRQYNIHVGAAGSVEPVEVVSMAAAPITAATPVTKSAPESKPAVKNASAAKASVAAPAAKTEMTPLERMQAKNYDLSKPVLVEAGYTPWSLGVLYQKRYPNASVNQVLVALAIHNPEAFPAGNVRQLKAGAKVTAPSASLVESINAQTAREIVQKGLSIEEVAQRPAPIKEVRQEAPKHKKPLPSIQTAPVKHLPVTKEEIQSDVKIGARSRIQSHSFICSLVEIGEDCFIGHGVMFINDLFSEGAPSKSPSQWKSTKIGNHVSIGSNATILPVSICDGVEIGAGSVVCKDITQKGVYAGNPARKIRDL